MHRIDTSGATVDNKFFDGSPAQGIPSTIVDDDWLNAVQEELVNIVLQAGLALEKGTNTQVWQALLTKFAAITDLAAHAALTNPHGATNAATANRIILRDGGGRAYITAPIFDEQIANKQYVDIIKLLGFGREQSWQTVARAKDVTYQNLSMRPIMVSILVSGYFSTIELQASANGSTWVTVDFNHSVDNARPSYQALQAVIPENHYYRVTHSGGTWVISSWAELR